MPTSSELRKRAWESLKGTYWIGFFVILVANILSYIQGGVQGFFASLSEAFLTSGDDYLMAMGAILYLLYLLLIGLFWLLAIFVTYPLVVGTKRFFIENTSGKPSFSVLKTGFTVNYKGNVFIMFLMNLKILLWSLLFIIPGIIKTYEYAMIPYILADNRGISYADAFKITKKYMTGNKLKLFVLEISFFPWILLTLLTCGMGTYFLLPYMEAAIAEFYMEVKNLNTEEPIAEQAPVPEN